MSFQGTIQHNSSKVSEAARVFASAPALLLPPLCNSLPPLTSMDDTAHQDAFLRSLLMTVDRHTTALEALSHETGCAREEGGQASGEHPRQSVVAGRGPVTMGGATAAALVAAHAAQAWKDNVARGGSAAHPSYGGRPIPAPSMMQSSPTLASDPSAIGSQGKQGALHVTGREELSSSGELWCEEDDSRGIQGGVQYTVDGGTAPSPHSQPQTSAQVRANRQRKRKEPAVLDERQERARKRMVPSHPPVLSIPLRKV